MRGPVQNNLREKIKQIEDDDYQGPGQQQEIEIEKNMISPVPVWTTGHIYLYSAFWFSWHLYPTAT